MVRYAHFTICCFHSTLPLSKALCIVERVMEPITLEKELSELMSAHDIQFHIENEWVVPYGKLPAIRATWYPREESGLLEIDVLLEDQRFINECFAGVGSGRSGLNDALQNFCVNSFHVLLASFLGGK